ncbi:unnamed protein product [Cuscuta epithymum]|uniref:Uncharacterized protein n=1 Tax=Cuscuta epithymum TaxID=186058 RepID=A0AAV0CHX7_9ASTE|nr:unnamed protein product [Cuscuta epithymum]
MRVITYLMTLMEVKCVWIRRISEIQMIKGGDSCTNKKKTLPESMSGTKVRDCGETEVDVEQTIVEDLNGNK